MNSVKVMLELLSDGVIDIKASTQDAAMIVLIIEKAKLKILQRVNLEEKSNILIPNGVN